MVRKNRPTMSERRLVIVGDSAIAQVAYEYFTHDSAYEVIGFAVEKAHRQRGELFGLPVVDFEEVDIHFRPDAHDAFVALGYGQMNRLRARLVSASKGKGYSLASYVSSRAFVWSNAKIGEHCFILEDNVIQAFVSIGDDVVLWSGNHVGHHSRIGNHVFVSSHVVISGSVQIGDSCFMGVNSGVANNITVGSDCLIGAGVMILRNAPAGSIYASPRVEPQGISTFKYFDISRGEST